MENLLDLRVLACDELGYEDAVYLNPGLKRAHIRLHDSHALAGQDEELPVVSVGEHEAGLEMAVSCEGVQVFVAALRWWTPGRSSRSSPAATDSQTSLRRARGCSQVQE